MLIFLFTEDAIEKWKSISWSVEKVKNPLTEGFLDVILLRSNAVAQDSPTPFLNFAHGGPHVCFALLFIIQFNFANKKVCFSTTYQLQPLYLCSLGYTVAYCNYRGSSGYGHQSLASLLGNIGIQDVKEVHAVTEHYTSMPFVDKNRVAIYGGSHGGFLTSMHLYMFCTAT